MPQESSHPPQPAPFFHDASGAVRLWVRTPAGRDVGAILRPQVLHYRFRATTSGADALTTYLEYRTEIDAAVLRRFAAGSLEPILLREADFGLRSAPAPPPLADADVTP